MPLPHKIDPASVTECPPSDPIQSLMDYTDAGVHSAIHYDKANGEAPIWRVIEPLYLVQGIDGFLIQSR